MPTYSEMNLLCDEFRGKGGNLRRQVLLDIHNKQQQCSKELDDARLALMNCSAIENPAQWNLLFNNVTSKAFKLNEISLELKMLESIHVNEFGGTLPY